MQEGLSCRTSNIAVGEFSRRAGCNIETIRYYERIGLLPKPRREKGGRFRRYDRDDVPRLDSSAGHGNSALRWTRFARCCGSLVVMARTCGDQARGIAAAHVADIRAKIADLQAMERVVTEAIRECDGRQRPRCPLIEVLSEGSFPAVESR